MHDAHTHQHNIDMQPDLVLMGQAASEAIGQPVHVVWVADQISEIDGMHHDGCVGFVDESGEYLVVDESIVEQLLSNLTPEVTLREQAIAAVQSASTLEEVKEAVAAFLGGV